MGKSKQLEKISYPRTFNVSREVSPVLCVICLSTLLGYQWMFLGNFSPIPPLDYVEVLFRFRIMIGVSSRPAVLHLKRLPGFIYNRLFVVTVKHVKHADCLVALYGFSPLACKCVTK